MRIKGHRAALLEYRENVKDRRLYVTKTGFVFCTKSEPEDTKGTKRIDNLIKDYYGIPGNAISETMVRVMAIKMVRAMATKIC